MISMEQIISRAAQRTANYYSYDDHWNIELDSLSFPALDETVVGIYHDDAICLVFMKERLFYYGYRHTWISIDYETIHSVRIKEETKDTASTLIVEHQNMITELSIQYANGKLRDIFPMKHVFTRIMQKVTRSKGLS